MFDEKCALSSSSEMRFVVAVAVVGWLDVEKLLRCSLPRKGQVQLLLSVPQNPKVAEGAGRCGCLGAMGPKVLPALAFLWGFGLGALGLRGE